MGCSSSRGVQVSQQPRIADSPKVSKHVSDKIETKTTLDDDFDIICANSEYISRIEGVNPIVCLGDGAFPIVTSNLFLDDDVPTNVSLPVIAASRYGCGISIAIGHISSLLEQKLMIRDSEIFFTSLFHWAISQSKKAIQNEIFESRSEALIKIQSDNEDDESSSNFDNDKQIHTSNTSSSKKALVIGFPQQFSNDVKKFLRQFSLSAELTSESKFKSKYDKKDQIISGAGDDIDYSYANETFFIQYSMILAASNVSFDKTAIQNYISRGGIFAALYIPPNLSKQIPTYCFSFSQKQNKNNISNSDLETAAFYILNDDNTTASESYLINPDIDMSTSYSINDTLIQTNLAFTYCSLSIGEPNSLSFKISNKFSRISSINFPSLIDSYISFLNEIQAKNNNLSSYEERLDDLVTDLRFYLMVIENDIENSHYEEVKLLLDTTWNYLSKSCPLCSPNHKNPNSSNTEDSPTILHTICIVLLTQMLYSIPLTEFSSSPLISAYLGDIPEPANQSKNNKVENGDDSHNIEKVKLTILPFSWISTGFWLPRGSIGTVRSNQEFHFLHVQIGCHQTSLLEKKGEWKRWPVIVMSYSINSKEIKISSPFGGLVYIVAEMIPNNESIEVEFEFEGFKTYPRSVMNSPEIWEKTSKADKNGYISLWSEFEAPNFIFTLPTSFLMKNEDKVDKYFNIFDKLMNEILSFSSCQPKKPFRIVFDVDIVDDDSYEITYPLVLLMDEVDKIFVTEQPTKELLKLLKSLTLISIRDGCIDSMTEDAVSVVSACSAIKSVWNDFDPLQLVDSDSSLYKALWDIHSQCGKKIIPNTLSIFQDANFVSPDTQEDMWMQFVTELCNNGKRDFTNMLKKARPIPMNISSSIQSFPDY